MFLVGVIRRIVKTIVPVPGDIRHTKGPFRVDMYDVSTRGVLLIVLYSP